MSSPVKQFYEFGPFRLDPAEHSLWRDGQPVPLRPKVLDILLVLVKRNGCLVEKDELMQAIWPEQFVEEGNLNKNISMLRQALGENGAGYIETVPKRGYRFVAPVRTVQREEAEPAFKTNTGERLVIEVLRDDPQTAEDGVSRVQRWHKSWLILAAASMIILLAAAIYIFYSARNGDEVIDSVAVLPFVNESGDADDRYLSDGISESLINRLSRLTGVRVIARDSSFKYRGKELNAQQVGRTLGVKAVLMGRVLRRGEQLQISVELVNALNNAQIWAEQYNLDATELPALEANIAGKVAEKLRLRLTSAEQRQLARRETVNSVAYQLLLQGRFYSTKATDSQKKAIEYFNQAIAVDPDYALAYAELSFVYNSLVNENVLDQKEFIPKAEKAALMSLLLDESLAEAHLAVAVVKANAWDWAAAEREYRRAIELSPNLIRAHSKYMFYLIVRGRREQAIAESERVRELDPLSSNAPQAAVYGLLLSGQNEQAIEAAKRLLEQDQSNPQLHALVGVTYAGNRQYQEALAAYLDAIRLGDDSPDTRLYLGIAYAQAGQPEKTRLILKRLEKGKEYVSPVGLAMLYGALGEREQSFALLERAYSAHDQQLIWLGVDKGFDPLCSDPRFQDLMRRMGLFP